VAAGRCWRGGAVGSKLSSAMGACPWTLVEAASPVSAAGIGSNAHVSTFRACAPAPHCCRAMLATQSKPAEAVPRPGLKPASARVVHLPPAGSAYQALAAMMQGAATAHASAGSGGSGAAGAAAEAAAEADAAAAAMREAPEGSVLWPATPVSFGVATSGAIAAEQAAEQAAAGAAKAPHS
jgi:hypothetical protein